MYKRQSTYFTTVLYSPKSPILTAIKSAVDLLTVSFTHFSVAIFSPLIVGEPVKLGDSKSALPEASSNILTQLEPFHI